MSLICRAQQRIKWLIPNLDSHFSENFDQNEIRVSEETLVKTVKQWPHSTFHHLVKQGFYSENWGGTEQDLNVGERLES